ncbi:MULTISPECIES: hypothetical protein [unclassified Streptomyces]|uniref:hypothetical protein n=1 Tax=unclassified Streptomyces TaxID=2593676 RepID=UPI002E800CD7|nr:hypothetical protein [Streptomyces sp. NBC_00589]WTI42364.1 hypothetical protein OIC96_49475 [Streptomyces sp. NBC_00775]WUB23954.1 hypothetical protein OHA51_00255 [Streptomyces sp. NBC_00589]
MQAYISEYLLPEEGDAAEPSVEELLENKMLPFGEDDDIAAGAPTYAIALYLTQVPDVLADYYGIDDSLSSGDTHEMSANEQQYASDFSVLFHLAFMALRSDLDFDYIESAGNELESRGISVSDFRDSVQTLRAADIPHWGIPSAFGQYLWATGRNGLLLKIAEYVLDCHAARDAFLKDIPSGGDPYSTWRLRALDLMSVLHVVRVGPVTQLLIDHRSCKASVLGELLARFGKSACDRIATLAIEIDECAANLFAGYLSFEVYGSHLFSALWRELDNVRRERGKTRSRMMLREMFEHRLIMPPPWRDVLDRSIRADRGSPPLPPSDSVMQTAYFDDLIREHDIEPQVVGHLWHEIHHLMRAFWTGYPIDRNAQPNVIGSVVPYVERAGVGSIALNVAAKGRSFDFGRGVAGLAEDDFRDHQHDPEFRRDLIRLGFEMCQVPPELMKDLHLAGKYTSISLSGYSLFERWVDPSGSTAAKFSPHPPVLSSKERIELLGFAASLSELIGVQMSTEGDAERVETYFAVVGSLTDGLEVEFMEPVSAKLLEICLRTTRNLAEAGSGLAQQSWEASNRLILNTFRLVERAEPDAAVVAHRHIRILIRNGLPDRAWEYTKLLYMILRRRWQPAQ